MDSQHYIQKHLKKESEKELCYQQSTQTHLRRIACGEFENEFSVEESRDEKKKENTRKENTGVYGVIKSKSSHGILFP